MWRAEEEKKRRTKEKKIIKRKKRYIFSSLSWKKDKVKPKERGTETTTKRKRN